MAGSGTRSGSFRYAYNHVSEEKGITTGMGMGMGMDDEPKSAEVVDNTTPYGISIKEDVETVLEKMKDAINCDDLSWLPGAGEIPLDKLGETYW